MANISLNGNIIYTHIYVYPNQRLLFCGVAEPWWWLKFHPPSNSGNMKKTTKVFSFNVSKWWAGGCLMIDVFFLPKTMWWKPTFFFELRNMHLANVSWKRSLADGFSQLTNSMAIWEDDPKPNDQWYPHWIPSFWMKSHCIPAGACVIGEELGTDVLVVCPLCGACWTSWIPKGLGQWPAWPSMQMRCRNSDPLGECRHRSKSEDMAHFLGRNFHLSMFLSNMNRFAYDVCTKKHDCLFAEWQKYIEISLRWTNLKRIIPKILRCGQASNGQGVQHSNLWEPHHQWQWETLPRRGLVVLVVPQTEHPWIGWERFTAFWSTEWDVQKTSKLDNMYIDIHTIYIYWDRISTCNG